eukprot:scaffold6.g2792.t1
MPSQQRGLGIGLVPSTSTISEVNAPLHVPTSPNADAVVREFHEGLARSTDIAVAALTSVIKKSTATTMMGINQELSDAAKSLQRCNPTAISLKAGCELFLRYTTRTSALESDNFAAAKKRLIERGQHFAETSKRARAAIAEHGERFIRSGSTVLCHGHSRVVLSILRKAAAAGKQFRVIVTEGRPDETGLTMARVLEELRLPVTVVLDSGVGYIMERVDMVLVGAEAVVENGGVINKLGTNQRDMPLERKQLDFGPLLPTSVAIDNPSRDYTPPQARRPAVPRRCGPRSFISLLFTDLGVLTPAAVSDELIQLYV